MVVLFPPILATVTLAGTLLFNSMISTTTIQTTSYEFENGVVKIDNPMRFRGMNLVEPKLLGAGGGGSVWNMRAIRKHDVNDVAVKISWERSTASVRNECDILNAMERQGVTGVERCLGNMEYKYDPRRVVIVMEPFIEDISNDNDDNDNDGDITSSLADLSPKIARRSTIQLSKTMAQMLSSNIATTDLQPLISKSTGEVTLIDMTEAKVVLQPSNDRDHSSKTITETDKALINSFCTEMIGLIPEYLLDEIFSESFVKELHRIETEQHVVLDADVKEILRGMPFKGAEKIL